MLRQDLPAAFEPLPPHLDVDELVKSTPSFEKVCRIDCNSLDENGLEAFEKLVLFHVVFGGKPLVIEGFHERLDRTVFSERWLRQHHSGKTEVARDLGKGTNLSLTMGHYLKNLPRLANQVTSFNYNDGNRQRLYLKDIDCPSEWHDQLEALIPPSLFYFNASRQIPFKGPGSTQLLGHENPEGTQEAALTRAGDLMSSLPPTMRAENLMCYIGYEGTYTPAHQEMCASLGHNLMVDASDGSIEHGKATRPGSSVWFMTETKDRHVVREYWMSVLKHHIDLENHFAPLKAWQKAPFTTYIVEQKLGDFILVPPLAAHQVWNRGTRTMKVAWNRTTAETLEMAMTEALPHARMVCRDEQYKNKAIIYFSLKRYSEMLRRVKSLDRPEDWQLWQDFERLCGLYVNILLSEMFSTSLRAPRGKEIEYVEFESNITCSYCRCNIFNRFLTCPWCLGTLTTDGSDTYDICMDCYVMGRSCACISKLQWVEQFHWYELTDRYETWRQQVVSFGGFLENDEYEKLQAKFPSLTVARQRLRRKTLAEICQEQLNLRPWSDIKKPGAPDEKKASDSEDSPPRKRKKVKHRPLSKAKVIGRCHICKSAEPNWKLASCGHCNLQYCYGSLYRAFEIFPQAVLEQGRWQCPKCRKICNCAPCRRDEINMKPYEPRGTLLGHDTRKVADPRSIESLLSLRVSNSQWLRVFGDDMERRIENRQQEVEERYKQTSMQNRLEAEQSPFRRSTTQVNPGEIPSMEPEDDIPVDPQLWESSLLF